MLEPEKHQGAMIDLYTTNTLLRYKSEWDPRAHAHTKGGYLEGEIRVPQVAPNEPLQMRVETYPAEDVDAAIKHVHPCMLHLVRMGTGKRYNWLEPVPNKTHWKQDFKIVNGKVSVINTTSALDVEKDGSPRKIPAIDAVTNVHHNTIYLSASKEHLNMVFLKPKQTNCDATIREILRDRTGITDEEQLNVYQKHFIGKNGGVNLMRMRLKVTFCNSRGEVIASAVSPQTVVDNGNKKIGCMDMYDAWPRKSCSQGGRKIIMVSEYDLADDVKPMFEVYDAEGNHHEEMEQFISQPSNIPSMMALKNQTIIFLTPAQHNLNLIQERIGPFSIQLVAKRQGDGLVSRAFSFKYTQHDDATCDHTVDGVECAKIEEQTRAKPKSKKRIMNNNNRLVVPTINIKRSRTASGTSYGDSDPALSPHQTMPSPSHYKTMPSPSHSYCSGYNTGASGVGSPVDVSNIPETVHSSQTVTLTNVDMRNALPADVQVVLGLDGVNENDINEDMVRTLIGMPKKEEVDQLSISSVEELNEDDIFNNIDIEDLLNVNSPDSMPDINLATLTDMDMPMSPSGLNTPSVMLSDQDPMMGAAGGRHTTQVFLQKRQRGGSTKPAEMIQRDGAKKSATSEHLTEQKTKIPKGKITNHVETSPPSPIGQNLMIFVVMFILVACMVQCASDMLDHQLTGGILLGLSSVISIGVATGKYITKHSVV